MAPNIGGGNRVVFTFDEGSYNMLEEMKNDFHFSSLADTIREAMRIVSALQSQAKEGYSQVIVQNPHDLGQRRLVIDSLSRINTNMIPHIQDKNNEN